MKKSNRLFVLLLTAGFMLPFGHVLLAAESQPATPAAQSSQMPSGIDNKAKHIAIHKHTRKPIKSRKPTAKMSGKHKATKRLATKHAAKKAKRHASKHAGKKAKIKK